METILVQPTTITIFSQNTPGVLYRIANLFLRRKINIESLTVSEIKSKSISRFTIVVKEDSSLVKKIVRQLARIVEVYDVYAHNNNELLFQEVAMFRVRAANQKQYQKIEEIAYQLKASVVQKEKDNIVLKKTGSEEDIDFLRNILDEFGIMEFVRSGRIALEKGKAEENIHSAKALKSASRSAEVIDISIIKRVELMARTERGVISLAQGVPSFFTAKHIRDAAKHAIDTNLVDKYTPGYGIQPLRLAIAKKVKKENSIDVAADEVIVTHGGIEALMSIFMALLNVEDEIIVLTPDYASHLTQITIATHGAKPIAVPLVETEKEWVLDAHRLEGAITPRTKAILICNPCNPTGKVYTKEELQQIALLAIKHNLFIITDEMYEHFVFDGKQHVSIGSFKNVSNRTISVFGVSKSYAMTGWRIGYIVARKNLIDQIMKIHDSLITCPTAVSQYAALAAIQGPKDVILSYKKEYEKRRAIVAEELAKTTFLRYTLPQGAYYSFPKLTKPIDDITLATRLIKEAKVAVVPGTPFGAGGEHHIRISFGCEEETLREGLRRLVGYLNKLT